LCELGLVEVKGWGDVVIVLVEDRAEKQELSGVCSFPFDCTLLNLHLEEQAPTAMMQAGGIRFDLQVPLYPCTSVTRDRISTPSSLTNLQKVISTAAPQSLLPRDRSIVIDYYQRRPYLSPNICPLRALPYNLDKCGHGWKCQISSTWALERKNLLE